MSVLSFTPLSPIIGTEQHAGFILKNDFSCYLYIYIYIQPFFLIFSLDATLAPFYFIFFHLPLNCGLLMVIFFSIYRKYILSNYLVIQSSEKGSPKTKTMLLSSLVGKLFKLLTWIKYGYIHAIFRWSPLFLIGFLLSHLIGKSNLIWVVQFMALQLLESFREILFV